MTLSQDLWVQSLLLISASRSSRQSIASGASQTTLQTQDGKQEPVPPQEIPLFPDVPDPSRLTSRSISAPLEHKHISIPDLCRDEPYWISRMNPLNRQFIENLGNGILVAALPVQLSFYLYGVIWGRQPTDYSWEITGPQQKTPVQTVASSPPQKLTFLYVGMLSQLSAQDDLGLKVATIYKNISVTFSERGLYFVSLKLNGEEAGRIPFVVRHSGSEESD